MKRLASEARYNILGLAEAADRVHARIGRLGFGRALEQPLPHRTLHARSREVRENHPRVDGVDAYPVTILAALHGRDLGQVGDRGLGGGVNAGAPQRDHRADRGHVDDGAAPARDATRFHGPDGVLHAEKDSVAIDGHDLSPIPQRHVFHEVHVLDARVVDQDVDAAERPHGLRNDRLPLFFVGDVQAKGHGLATRLANLPHDLLCEIGIDIGHHDLRAGFRQESSTAGADAARRASHERHFSVDPERVRDPLHHKGRIRKSTEPCSTRWLLSAQIFCTTPRVPAMTWR